MSKCAALGILERFVLDAFPDADQLYYERSPNVRFHIPYDLAAEHRHAFDEFAKQYGQGKLSAHGPHRDSWLDCPSNAINVWFAIGHVRRGNGLTIFAEDYKNQFNYQQSGDIADGEVLDRPLTFDLNPGDAIIFHGDHLHGSELNQTDETRFVISFRITFGKPHFPNGHYHRYVNAGWTHGLLKPLASLPANLQMSYSRSFLERAGEKLMLRSPSVKSASIQTPTVGEMTDGVVSIPLRDVPVGAIVPATTNVCVARLSKSECVGISRRCPHRGGDFANGRIEADAIVCPWHNLSFDLESGKSKCRTLPRLRHFSCEITDGRILVNTNESIKATRESSKIAVDHMKAEST